MIDDCIECYGSAEEKQLMKSYGAVMRPGTIMPYSLVRGTIIQRFLKVLSRDSSESQQGQNYFHNNTKMFIALFFPGGYLPCNDMVCETYQHIKDVHHSEAQCNIIKSLTSEGSIQIAR